MNISEIQKKYQVDASGSEDSPSSLKSAADVLKKSISMYKNGSAPVSAYNAIQRIRVRALELQKTSMDAVKYAKAVADECEGLLKKNGTRLKM